MMQTGMVKGNTAYSSYLDGMPVSGFLTSVLLVSRVYTLPPLVAARRESVCQYNEHIPGKSSREKEKEYRE